jgi:quercetin dioxygenase-like cupin family protein
VPLQPKQPTTKGPAEWLTGHVFIDPVARGEEPSRVRVSAVRFTPAARTAWHTASRPERTTPRRTPARPASAE